MPKPSSPFQNWSIIGATSSCALYLLLLFLTRDLDFIIFKTGPFGIIFLLLQNIGFFFGGWPLATLLSLVFCAFCGFILGKILQQFFKNFK